MRPYFQFKTIYFLFVLLVLQIITYAQNPGIISARGAYLISKRHLAPRIELGIQSDKFYSNIGMQLSLPNTSDKDLDELPLLLFSNHGPYLGIINCFQ